MSDENDHMWRNVCLAGARGLERTFGAIARALAGEEPIEATGFSLDHDLEPSQSNKTGGKGKRERKEKKEKKEKRAPTTYNLFVSEQLKVLREKYPDMPHTEHFKRVAQDWKTSTKNKKNVGAESEAPRPSEMLKAAAAAASPVLDDDEEGEEVTGGRGELATQEELGTQERAEKKEKKKRKKERREEDAAHEVGGTGFHRAIEGGEQATPEKRSSKKGKR